MVNLEAFIKRIEKILDFYGLTAAAFADKIEVQRSSISHLLSGRNKPSLEFVLKVVNAFPEVNLYWLLNGKGSFPYKAEKQLSNTPSISSLLEIEKTSQRPQAIKKIEKIILFYNDGSFETYNP